MNILLTGASGFIGGHIRQALLAAGHHVTPVSRQHGLDFTRMLTPQDWLPHLQNVEVVINSVGIIAETRGQTFAALHYRAPAALFRACVMAGVPRVVQISALGADEQAFTPYQLSKKAADDVLRELPLEWFVLRPSLVYGEGGKSSALFRYMANLPVIPRVGDGGQRIQPVHVSDVVATVMQCLQVASARRTLDVVGAYPLSFVEWLQAMRREAGKKPALTLPIPLGLVMASAQVGRFLVPMLHPDNLRMLQRGNVANVQPLADFLGRSPHPPALSPAKQARG
ncbi:MAG TPA: NAD(P)H-binding protein [Candidatus Thiothrix moscowensis]|uniref:NAD-dependent epimerase/dehydratase family protein n=1 Tax=unclassified Thiothrix TaxID=2636184 RepID=UPI0025E2EE8A|nr:MULTISPECIES: NAD-dependent epimerase/dehydratase family protein [unclassified Thiothrix]HRJ51448.1 NAD(P)H-binding protein [Candidatus Thiothrix moscowensis]HRJ91497.1 NAD(P)H-binding protein [Candidatus Thiothrix moscowensis]